MGGLSLSPFCVVVMKVTARSRPAKGWPSLMKTDEAEIKCLPTLRDSFITVSPRAMEHLGLELSFNRPCLTAPWWHTAAFQAHEHLHLYFSFSVICGISFASCSQIILAVYISTYTLSHSQGLHKLEWGFSRGGKKIMSFSGTLSKRRDLAVLAGPPSSHPQC